MVRGDGTRGLRGDGTRGLRGRALSTCREERDSVVDTKKLGLIEGVPKIQGNRAKRWARLLNCVIDPSFIYVRGL